MKLQAVFLDRDGTIGGSDQVEYPGEFELFSFSENVIKDLQNNQIQVFSFTNQPGISQGKAIKDDFVKELMAFGFNDVYVCPHPHKYGCSCRKPAIGMLEKAAQDYHLDLSQCAVFGDRWTDIEAAKRAGCMSVLVLTGSGKNALEQKKTDPIQPDYIADNLQTGVEWLLKGQLLSQK